MRALRLWDHAHKPSKLMVINLFSIDALYSDRYTADSLVRGERFDRSRLTSRSARLADPVTYQPPTSVHVLFITLQWRQWDCSINRCKRRCDLYATNLSIQRDEKKHFTTFVAGYRLSKYLHHQKTVDDAVLTQEECNESRGAGWERMCDRTVRLWQTVVHWSGSTWETRAKRLDNSL